MRTIGILLLLSAAVGSAAHAQENQTLDSLKPSLNPNDPYFQIGKIHSEVVGVEEVALTQDEKWMLERSAFIDQQNEQFEKSNGGSAVSLSPFPLDPLAIANLLLRAWDIVESHRPVVNVESKGANALPNAAENDWTKLTGWLPRHVVTVNTYITNLAGTKVVDFTYHVRLVSGGSVRGAGRYINDMSIVPMKTEVRWGYDLDATVNVPSVVNLGTEEDPIAGIYMDVTYRISGMFHDRSATESFFGRADGYIENTKSKEVYFDGTPKPTPAPTPEPVPMPEEPLKKPAKKAAQAVKANAKTRAKTPAKTTSKTPKMIMTRAPKLSVIPVYLQRTKQPELSKLLTNNLLFGLPESR